MLLWRDFNITGPPEGSPLFAVLELDNAPPESLRGAITDVYLWVIKDSSEVWSTRMKLNFVEYWTVDRTHNYWAGDGPLWGPGIAVEVVIGIRTAHSGLFLTLFKGVPIRGTSQPETKTPHSREAPVIASIRAPELDDGIVARL